MTLDHALERFQNIKSASKAADLLTVATTYWHDEMISDETFDAIVRKVRDWLRD